MRTGATGLAGGPASGRPEGNEGPAPAVDPAATCSITSGLLTTPPRPVPVTAVRSTFCSAATRVAAGEARTSGAAAGAAGAAGTAGSGAFACASGAPDGAAGAAVAPSSTSASTSPTFTTSPSLTARRVSTPALSAGTSTVILSVSSSTRVSPDATASPSFLSQRDTVASTIDSPSGGTLIAVMGAPFRKKNRDDRMLSRPYTVA